MKDEVSCQRERDHLSHEVKSGLHIAMASKVELLVFYSDGVFEIALVSASVAVLDDELVPSCKEDIFCRVASEDVIVVIL